MICESCGFDEFRFKGYYITKLGRFKRGNCISCGTHNSFLMEDAQQSQQNLPLEEEVVAAPRVKMIEPDVVFDEEFYGYEGVIVTSAINDTEVNKPFFNSLVKFAEKKNAKLFVIPIKYLNPSAMNMNSSVSWDPVLEPYLLRRTVRWKDQFKIIGDCNIQATAANPLSSIDSLCEGMSTIVGHPTLQMRTVAVNPSRNPIILHSTGSVSQKDRYSASKAGYRASFHHCYSAVYIEIDRNENSFHLRQLCADDSGSFFDLNEYHTPEGGTINSNVSAIVFGDEHVKFICPKVADATFGVNGLVEKLDPDYLVRHDVLDFHCRSHHDMNRFFEQYKKKVLEEDDVEKELNETCEFLHKTTGERTSVVVASNHHSHLLKWLETTDPKMDLVNSKVYHLLMWLMMEYVDTNGESMEPFELYFKKMFPNSPNITFQKEDDFHINGICVSMHGDKGANGARGSRQNLSKIGERSVIGHSHSPGIQGGCWQTGTSSKLRMGYNVGPSSWLNTHCIIHRNGKRQLVTLIKGKFSRDL